MVNNPNTSVANGNAINPAAVATTLKASMRTETTAASSPIAARVMKPNPERMREPDAALAATADTFQARCQYPSRPPMTPIRKPPKIGFHSGRRAHPIQPRDKKKKEARVILRIQTGKSSFTIRGPP